MNFVFRTDRLPIVDVEFPSMFDKEQYLELFARYRSLSLEHGRLAYIIDMRKFNPLKASAALRKQAAAVFNENVTHIVTATVCEARIVSDQLTRGSAHGLRLAHRHEVAVPHLHLAGRRGGLGAEAARRRHRLRLPAANPPLNSRPGCP